MHPQAPRDACDAQQQQQQQQLGSIPKGKQGGGRTLGLYTLEKIFYFIFLVQIDRPTRARNRKIGSKGVAKMPTQAQKK